MTAATLSAFPGVNFSPVKRIDARNANRHEVLLRMVLLVTLVSASDLRVHESREGRGRGLRRHWCLRQRDRQLERAISGSARRAARYAKGLTMQRPAVPGTTPAPPARSGRGERASGASERAVGVAGKRQRQGAAHQAPAGGPAPALLRQLLSSKMSRRP